MVDGQWSEKTPEIILEGFSIYPALEPVWEAFQVLSRARGVAPETGAPLPLLWRDVRDMAAEIEWEWGAKEVEQLLFAADRKFCDLVHEKLSKEQSNV